MAAHALVTLGRADEVVAWACRYAERLPEASDEVRAARARLGARLRRQGWKATVADMVPLLMPGVLAGAFHAVIRVAHAVDMVEAEASDVRLDELAAALAYFVERREPLGPTPELGRGRSVQQALDALPPVPDDPARWLIFERARAVRDDPAFHAAVAGVDLPADPVRAAWALASVGRDLFLAQPHAPIVYVHAVTGPLAVATLLPLLDRTAAVEAVAHTWQALAAVHAAYRRPPAPLPDLVPAPWPALVDRAVQDGDEHAIKGVLAFRTGHHRDGDPRWALAAARLLGPG